MNVSSIVVKTAPEYRDEVIAGINSIDLCEVHFSDASGRIVATIEGETIGDEMAKLERIQGMPHVLSADLMYAYSEGELAEAMEQIKKGNPVPERLKS
ncbi:MAG TPA: chaperone NapD [Thermodesulfovibrionales bacterium]|nr:chaperone NapD [Thermodesulfovibrionales bacterium]